MSRIFRKGLIFRITLERELAQTLAGRPDTTRSFELAQLRWRGH